MNVNHPRQAPASRGSSPTLAFAMLHGELRRLDLRIRRAVSGLLTQEPSEGFQPFQGLVVTDQEVRRILDEFDREHDALPPPAVVEDHAELSGERQTLGDLASRFQLSRLEQHLLLVALAPEVDGRYERLYAFLHDDVTRKAASVELATMLFCESPHERWRALSSFQAHSPLRRHRLIEWTDQGPVTGPLRARGYKLDERVIAFLLGDLVVDSRVSAFAGLMETRVESLVRCNEQEKDSTEAGRQTDGLHKPDLRSGQGAVFFVSGARGVGKKRWVEAECGEAGLPLLRVEARQMLRAETPFALSAGLIARESRLLSAAVMVDEVDAWYAVGEPDRTRLRQFLELVAPQARAVFLVACESIPIEARCGLCAWEEVSLPMPSCSERRRVWRSQLKRAGVPLDSELELELDLDALASNFSLTPGQIGDAVASALGRTLGSARRRPGGVSPSAAMNRVDLERDELRRACREQLAPAAPGLMRKVESKYTWNDLVLPDEQVAHLRECCGHTRHRLRVFDDWGFGIKLSRGRGVSLLFCGPPGVGKTMAAEVIANDLELDLYKIDLSQIVSKYIGETEKNLERVFTAAENSPAILFFDEADALFGKRSEVKDAHDRYANIEVGFLLQKMEEFSGVAILATNLRQNMDEAFVRRMRFIIEFPFPDEQLRKGIWRSVFPGDAPLDANLDFDFLAREIRLPGGSIKNIALAAAFLAAQDGGMIRMNHLHHAARREYQKVGRVWNAPEASVAGVGHS